MSSKKVNSTATARLKQDYMRIMKDPVPYIQAAPVPSNILEWCVHIFLIVTDINIFFLK